MNQDEIFTRVQRLMCQTLKVPAERVHMQARLAEDLEVDSLFINELALGLEDEFSISVDDDAMPRLTTVESVVQFVSQQLGAK